MWKRLPDKLQHEDLKSGNPDFPRPSELAGIRIPVRVGVEGNHFRLLQEYKLLEGSEQRSGDGEEEEEKEEQKKDIGERILRVDSTRDHPTRSGGLVWAFL